MKPIIVQFFILLIPRSSWVQGSFLAPCSWRLPAHILLLILKTKFHKHMPVKHETLQLEEEKIVDRIVGRIASKSSVLNFFLHENCVRSCFFLAFSNGVLPSLHRDFVRQSADRDTWYILMIFSHFPFSWNFQMVYSKPTAMKNLFVSDYSKHNIYHTVVCMSGFCYRFHLKTIELTSMRVLNKTFSQPNYNIPWFLETANELLPLYSHYLWSVQHIWLVVDLLRRN